MRDSKWVKFVQDYTFVLKHKAGVESKVADAPTCHDFGNYEHISDWIREVKREV